MADYFVQMRTNSEYTPSQEMIDHVDAFLKLMKVFTGNKKFEDRIPAVENKAGGATMVDYLTRLNGEQKQEEIKRPGEGVYK